MAPARERLEPPFFRHAFVRGFGLALLPGLAGALVIARLVLRRSDTRTLALLALGVVLGGAFVKLMTYVRRRARPPRALSLK